MINLHDIRGSREDRLLLLAQLWFRGRKVLKVDGFVPIVETSFGTNEYESLTHWGKAEWDTVEKTLIIRGKIKPEMGQ